MVEVFGGTHTEGARPRQVGRGGPVKPTVGLVGLGAMGRPIAGALTATGTGLTVHDRAATARRWAAQNEVPWAGSPLECAQLSDVVILSLPSPEAVRDVVDALTGWSGVVLDTSTVDPATSRSMGDATGGRFADCPILGRPGSVGSWTIPVGGSVAAAATAAVVLAPLARSVVHVGPCGAASTLKVVNNMMLSVINAVTAEALALVEVSGVDPGTFVDIVSDSGAASVSGLFRDVAHRAVQGDFEPAFTLRLMQKDSRLALDLARDAGLPLLVVEAAEQLNTMGVALGHGDQDSIAVLKVLENLLGRDVRRHRK